MPDTGAPWNIPYVAASDLVKDWPTDNQTQAEAIANALDIGLGTNVQQTVKTDTLSFTSTSFIDLTGLTVTITPSSATSKVLLLAQVTASSGDNTNRNMVLKFAGGNTSTYVGDASGTKVRGVAIAGRESTTNGWSPADHAFNISMTYLDSPATTSPVTYSVQALVSSGTFYINRTNNDDEDRLGRFASTITAIEVAA